MYIVFKELKFKNINSYGNKETIFSLNKGLNCISGMNGQGKSTILDALCFCLFGKPFRKIKLKELINRDNKKKLYASVIFYINEDMYTITRTLKPDSLIIEKNNEPLDLLSSKALNQDEIDKIIGIDITLFRQVISLAINYNKPFLALKTPEKRDIIETIFNIKVFGKMLKNVKNNNSSIKTEHEINKRTIQLIKKNSIELQNQLKEYKVKKENFENDKKEQIKTIDEKINNIKTQINNIKIELSDDKKKVNGNKYTLESALKKSGEIEHNIKKCEKDLYFFENNNICPICKTDMTDEHKNEHIKDNEKEIERCTALKKDLKITIKYKKRIKDNLQKLKYLEEQIKTHEENKKYIKEQEFSIDLQKIEDTLENKKEEYIKVYNKLNESGKEIKLNDIIIKMLGDEGIKTYFFAKLIPILNTKVNEFLDLFDLPVTISFDDFMNETINTLKNTNVSYWAFSEGEKKRIDIAILLSFIETTKMISNWGCNLIIFDELLDNSTDSEGLDKIFEAISEMLFHDTKLCIYVISHRILDVDFDGKYTIKKNNGFSELTFENNF